MSAKSFHRQSEVLTVNILISRNGQSQRVLNIQTGIIIIPVQKNNLIDGDGANGQPMAE